MYIARVKRHNFINGYWFSCIEFSIVAVLMGSFGLYAMTVGKWALGIAGLGIALNCLPVIILAASSIKHRQSDLGIMQWFINQKVRQKYAQQHPEIGLDTTIIVIATSLPGAALVMAVIDAFFIIP